MNPVKEPPTESKWQAASAVLRCVECQSPLQYQSPQELSCSGCSRSFKIENQVLHTGTQYEGNNAIAADYYNSSLWPKFRFWEWVAHLPRGGERNWNAYAPLFRIAQRKVERKHYRQRLDLKNYDKQRQEMLKDIGADPYVD